MLKRQYTALRQFYGSDFRHDLIMTTVAFGALVLISFFAGFFMPDLANNMVEQFIQQLADLGVQEADGSISAMMLFANNMRAMIVSVCYGFIPFIRLPALSLGLNSVLLGLFAAYYVHNGFSLLAYLAGILPHGIFELPALVISLSCGLYLCRCISDSIRSKEKKNNIVGETVKQIMRVIAFQVAPLLLAAAFVEAYITPRILNLFL